MKIIYYTIIFFVLVQFAFSEEGWIRLNSPTDNNLELIDFYNNDFGIVGNLNEFYLTLNGCKSFTKIVKYFNLASLITDIKIRWVLKIDF